MFQGSPALAIANVGSNIAKILLVLGLSALCVPVMCDKAPVRGDLAGPLLASVLALLALSQGTVERWMGLVLVLGMLIYIALLLNSSRTPGIASDGSGRWKQGGTGTGIVGCRFSMVVLLAGAHLLVSGALGVARPHGVSEAIIGLRLVAIGTSLPELAVAIFALVRKNAEVAIGNIVGSCLFNILGILGISALVSPLAVPETIAAFDAWIMLAATILLIAFARTGWRINRAEGAALLLGYPVYLAALAS